MGSRCGKPAKPLGQRPRPDEARKAVRNLRGDPRGLGADTFESGVRGRDAK